MYPPRLAQLNAQVWGGLAVSLTGRKEQIPGAFCRLCWC